jgi:hypothetical protein
MALMLSMRSWILPTSSGLVNGLGGQGLDVHDLHCCDCILQGRRDVLLRRPRLLRRLRLLRGPRQRPQVPPRQRLARSRWIFAACILALPA